MRVHVKRSRATRLNSVVERDSVLAAASHRELSSSDGLDGAERVALDARDLDETAERVAGESEAGVSVMSMCCVHPSNALSFDSSPIIHTRPVYHSSRVERLLYTCSSIFSNAPSFGLLLPHHSVLSILVLTCAQFQSPPPGGSQRAPLQASQRVRPRP